MRSLVNVQVSGIDRTIKIFDSFYNQSISIPTNQYDIVLSFFRDVCETDAIAQNFTAFLFKVSQQSGLDAIELLENIKGTSKNKLQLNQTLAYYLNSFKSKTSLYGVAVIPKPVQPVARNVVL
jgi:hypothetical protein